VSEKKLLFSIGKKDLIRQTFCTGGKGGQHRNAKQNGVRFIHPPSGARAEHRDGRDQGKNEIEAFRKLTEMKEFQTWLKVEIARRMGTVVCSEEDVRAQILAKIDDDFEKGNVTVEEFEPNA
jgi:protein subunit release factor A